MENFSIKAKKTIKRIAAVGATGIMLGATIGGAMAATLGDYPAPFVTGGNFQQVALVIGDASAGSDTLALTDISTKLQSVASSQPGGTTAATTTTLTGGKVVEVPLGQGIANSSSAGFDIEQKQADISTLRKDVITFQSDTYNTHDALVLGRSSPSIATAVSEGQKDFGTDVVVKLSQTGVIKYIYAFDTSINMSAATTNDPLDIVFLGKPLKITKVSAGSGGTSFTATVGEEHFLNYGESVTVSGHTIKLENIGSSTCVVSVDGGTSTTIATGSTKTIGGIQVKCDSVVSRNTLAESAATLVIGTTATKTYNDQDPYVGEDKINPKWVWSIRFLDQNTKQSTGVSTTTNLPNITGVEFGVKSYFTKQTPSDDPAGVGECYNLPNNYISICMDSLKVNPSTDYAEYRFEYQSTVDLSRSGLGSRTSAPTVHMIGPTEGFILNNPSGGKWAVNGSSTTDKKTNEIWLYNFGALNVTGVFYKNIDGVMEYAGNLTLNSTDTGAEFARINYGNVKDTDVRILLFGGSAAPDTYNLTLFPSAGISSSTWSNPGTNSGNITTSWGITSGDFNRLGFTATTEEASEVRATNGPSTVQSIGTWDKDVMNSYGIIIKNPKSNGVADRVVMWMPNEQQVAKVRITGTASVTTETGAVVSATAPAARKASEISDIGQFNAILVGGPCVNKHVATLLGLSYPACGTDSKFQVNTATIQLVAQTSGKQALIVAGWEADDTRRAGVALRNYDDATIKAALAGKTSVSVTGQTLDLSGIKVA